MRKQFHVAVISAATLSMAAWGQTAPTPALLQVARVQVKPERGTEYREIEAKYTEAYKKGGGTLRVVYRNRAGNPYEYLVISAMPGYSALAGESVYVKGSTPAAMATLAARRNQCVTSVTVTYEKPIAGVSFTVEGSAASKLFRLVRTQVKPGMMDDYIALMTNEIVPALKKAGVTNFRARVVDLGGSHDVITSRIGTSGYADLDGPTLFEKALGKDGAAALRKKQRDLSVSQQYFVYDIVAEASTGQ